MNAAMALLVRSHCGWQHFTCIRRFLKQGTTSSVQSVNLYMLTKSLFPRVSNIDLAVIRAKSRLAPLIELEESMRMTMSLLLVAASMYQALVRKS